MPIGKPDAPNVIQAMSCLGCLLWCVVAILLLFVLTQIGQIWQDLGRVVGT